MEGKEKEMEEECKGNCLHPLRGDRRPWLSMSKTTVTPGVHCDSYSYQVTSVVFFRFAWTDIHTRIHTHTYNNGCMLGQTPQYLMDFCHPTSSVASRKSATTSICHQTTPSRSTLPAKHHHPTCLLCGWSVGVEFFAGLLV